MGSIRKAVYGLLGVVRSGIGKIRYKIGSLLSTTDGNGRINSPGELDEDAVERKMVDFELVELDEKDIGAVVFPVDVGIQSVDQSTLREAGTESLLFSQGNASILAGDNSLGRGRSLTDVMPFKGPIFIEMGQDPSTIEATFRKIGKDILFLYDIDDTLYHPSNELQEREKAFLVKEYLSLSGSSALTPFEEALHATHLYSATFHLHGKISLEEYWEMQSKFDYLQYLSPDPKLREFLLSMKNIRRCCFTNGPRERAENILTKMGLLDCFEVVISIGKYDKTFCCKPLDVSYGFVTKVLGIEISSNVFFFDDSKENIDKSQEVGWNGYLMTAEDNIIDVSNRALRDLRENAKKHILTASDSTFQGADPKPSEAATHASAN